MLEVTLKKIIPVILRHIKAAFWSIACFLRGKLHTVLHSYEGRNIWKGRT